MIRIENKKGEEIVILERGEDKVTEQNEHHLDNVLWGWNEEDYAICSDCGQVIDLDTETNLKEETKKGHIFYYCEECMHEEMEDNS